jgi:uncharacterized phage protein gp47/JayE
MAAPTTPPQILVPRVPADPSTALSIDHQSLSLVLKTPATAVFVEATVKGSATAVFTSTKVLFDSPYYSNAAEKYFSLDLILGSGLNTIQLAYYNTYPNDPAKNDQKSPVFTLLLEFDTSSLVATVPLPPTGFSVEQRTLDVKVSWGKPEDSATLGNNFYLATVPGGPYSKINDAPITMIDPDAADGDRVMLAIPINAIPASYIGRSFDTAPSFYCTVTTLVQSDTEGILESPFSVEFEIKFFRFPSVYVPAVGRSEKEIQTALLGAVNNYDLPQDLKPGAVLQDLFVNTTATEFARAYQRQLFYHLATSAVTLTMLEDENGDGFSDTLTQSPMRRQLQQAFSLAADVDVQQWLDSAWDRLAAKYFDGRRGQTRATGWVTFYTAVPPSKTIVIPAYTTLTSDVSVSGSSSASYRTTQTGVIPLNSAASYYNKDLSRWEVKVRVESLVMGSSGNVVAGIVNTASYSDNGIQVVNEENISGGRDIETNLELAIRLRDVYLAKDSGRKSGIQSWLSQVDGIQSVKVVGASDKYMMRDYDELRDRHIYGRADAYVYSHATAEQTQTLVMKPTTLVADQTQQGLATGVVLLSTSSSTSWDFQVTDSRISITTPVYNLISLKNLTKNINYSSQNWRVSQLAQGSCVISLDPTKQSAPSGVDPTPAATDKLSLEVNLVYQNGFQFTTQPVLSLNSLVGADASVGGAGTVDVNNTIIVETQDPLGLGSSVRDDKKLVILPVIEDSEDTFTFPTQTDTTLPPVTTYTAVRTGVVPLSNYYPVILDVFSGTEYAAGSDFTLAINSQQQLVVTRVVPTTGSTAGIPEDRQLQLKYKTYQVFPRLFASVKEPLVLNGTLPSYLQMLGVDPTSIKVYSDSLGTNQLVRGTHYKVTPVDDGIVTYTGSLSPYDSDYWAAQPNVILGVTSALSVTDVTKLGIENLSLAQIPDGSTVYVDYNYYENLTASYTVDSGVINAQNSVADKVHATMNLLVKRCVEVPVTIEMQITLAQGYTKDTMENQVRAAVSDIFDRMNVGDGLTEAEVIRAVKSVTGVANVTVPLNRLSYSDGAQLIFEPIDSWVQTTELDDPLNPRSATAKIYKSNLSSRYKSLPNGGDWWQYVAVYEDGIPLDRVLSADDFGHGKGNVSGRGTFYLQQQYGYYVTPFIMPTRSAVVNSDVNTHSHSLTYRIYGDESVHDFAGTDLTLLYLDKLSLDFVEL